ncbi:hypothetical protein [Sporosarcina sp. NPDC096371]|uniref:hypothetical protein n=1 Tax=Sporosarcina sp. NPDC096371 TaxID=3364530 RepID=UPI003819F174
MVKVKATSKKKTTAWVGVRAFKVKIEVILMRPSRKELAAKDGRLTKIEELYCCPSPRLLEGNLKLPDRITNA